MDLEKPPVESWEMMQAMKMSVGSSGMQKIFSVGQTQINRYCRNPKTTGDSERNPIDRLRLLLEMAHDAGEESTVLAVLRHLAEPFGMAVGTEEKINPNLPTSWQEAGEDVECMGVRNNAMRAGEHPNIVDVFNDSLIAETKETCKQYRIEYEEEHQAAAKTAPFGHVYRVGKVRPDKVLLSEGGGEERQ